MAKQNVCKWIIIVFLLCVLSGVVFENKRPCGTLSSPRSNSCTIRCHDRKKSVSFVLLQHFFKCLTQFCFHVAIYSLCSYLCCIWCVFHCKRCAMEYREFQIFRLSVNELQKSLFEELNSIAPIPVCTCSSTKWKVRSHSRLVAICFTCSSKCLIQILLLTSARRYDSYEMCTQ